MNFQSLNKQRKFILVLSALGIISLFLPWITLLGMWISGFHGSGILVFLCFLCVLIVSLMGDQAKPLDRTLWMVALIAGAIALLVTLIDLVSGVGGTGFDLAGNGFGFWIALIASAGIVLFTWLLKSPGVSLKEGLDDIRKNISGSVNPGASTAAPSRPDKVAELERLIELRNQGKITEEEYQQFKSKL